MSADASDAAGSPPAAGDDKIDRSTKLALVAMGLAVLIIANDFAALNVALPAMEKDFDSDVSTIQWVVNAYALVFGVLIVTGGRLADMLGRRRVFFVGAAIFALFSLLGGAAQTDWQLIAARSLMGVGGALMWPAILGMTFAALPQSKAGFAGSFVLGVAGIGNALGPLLGGLLTQELSWRWVLWINIPIAAFAVFVTWRTIHQKVDEQREGIDYAGILSVSFGMVALLIALDQGTEWGWGDWRIIALFAVCALLLIGFVVIERTAGAKALIPRDVANNGPFMAAALATLLMSAIFFAALLYLPQYLQKIQDATPIEAGLGILPVMGLFAVTSFISGPLYTRLGAKPVIGAGTICLTIGIFALSFLETDSSYLSLVPGMVVLGIGVGLFYPSITTAGITSLDPSRTSLAGGIVYMAQIAGGAAGLALTTTIFTSVSQSTLADDLPAGTSREDAHAADGLLAGTETGAQAVREIGVAANEIQERVQDAFVAGVQAGFRLDAALGVAGCVVAILFVGGRLRGRRAPAAATAGAPGTGGAEGPRPHRAGSAKRRDRARRAESAEED